MILIYFIKIGGRSGIRTHGGFLGHNSFQDYRHKPNSATLPLLITISALLNLSSQFNELLEDTK